MGKYWTTGEIEDLRILKTVEGLTNKEISKILERTEASVFSKTKKCKLLKFENWTKQSDELLEKLVFNTYRKIEEIARKLGRTELATKTRMKELFGSSSIQKLRNLSFLNNSETRFMESEIEFLKKNYYKKGAKECAKILKRTSQSIVKKIYKLKKHGVEFEEQFIPRFNGNMRGYVIYSNKTGKIIKRYNTLEEWVKE